VAGKGFADRLKNLLGIRPADEDDFYDELADGLVEGDLGAAEALEAVDALRTECRRGRIDDPREIRLKLADILLADLRSASTAPLLGFERGKLSVLLLLGVNGVGKTTTAAKLTRLYRDVHGMTPLLAAADTFRAAAIDQLKIHGERLNVRVVAHKHGGDPAAVIYDAIDAARAARADLIIADTAGRMHTKSGLVEELKKIDRIVASKAEGGAYRKILVLDATTGRNALAQAETFRDAVGVDAVVLTKYDSSARGGVAFPLAKTLGLPVAFVCTGEGYGDIAPFDGERYAREFVGLD
jgi:fused signal recognition particle receptor